MKSCSGICELFWGLRARLKFLLVLKVHGPKPTLVAGASAYYLFQLLGFSALRVFPAHPVSHLSLFARF